MRQGLTFPHWLDLAGFPLKSLKSVPSAVGGNGNDLSRYNSGRERGPGTRVSAQEQLSLHMNSSANTRVHMCIGILHADVCWRSHFRVTASVLSHTFGCLSVCVQLGMCMYLG